MERFLIKKTININDKPAIQTQQKMQSSENTETIEIDNSESVINERCKGSSSTGPTKGIQKKKKFQKFRSIWVEKFNWVIEKDSKPYCKLCSKILSNNINHIERHKNSTLHITKVESLKNQPAMYESDEHIEQKTTLRAAKISELILIMFILQHNLPFSLIEDLIILIKSIASDSKIVKYLKLGKTKATETVTSVIHNDGLEQICKNLRSQPFSIIIDETTDVSTSKCLAVVTRYYDKIAGKVKDRFLNLIELDNCDAKSIYESLKKLFDRNKIPLKNLIGFAADNASVMMGHKNGVQKLLQKDNSSLYVLGCICHSFHLCSSATCKKLPQNVEIMARNIYVFFAHSAKRQTEYKEFQELFDVKFHKILKTSSTRWLSLENVVNRILEQWTALKHFFISYDFENNDLASKILSEMTESNKLYFHFLLYILKLTNKINVEFQSESPKIHLLLPTIETYVKTILNNFIKSEYIGSNINEIDFSRNDIFLNIESLYLGGKAELLIESGTLKDEEVNAIKLICRSYYIELCNQIFKRINFDDPTLTALKGLNPKSLGKSIVPLYKRFSNVLQVDDLEELDEEWRILLNYSGSDIDKNLDLDEFWFQVFQIKNGLKEKMFPLIEKFISALLCFPHSSATAERVFSQLNLIKNKQRNALHTTTVNAIMVAKEMLENVKASHWIPSDNLIKCYNKSIY